MEGLIGTPGGGAVRPITEEIFTAFDVETTGLIAGSDRLVEIGAVRFRGGTVLDEFQELIDPGIPMPASAGCVNGITDEMLEGKPGASCVLPRFLEFLGCTPLVAHNARFDVGFLHAEAALHRLCVPECLVFDTKALAMKAFPRRFRYSLESLKRDHGFGGGESHRALADAHACRELFLLCVERLACPGVASLEDLARIARGSSGPRGRSGPPMPLSGRGPEDAACIAALKTAIEEGRIVQITYVSGKGERTVRRITPVGFCIVGSAPAVEAYCHLREEDRKFLISSIERIERVP